MKPNPKQFALTVGAYLLATMIVQPLNHFAINKAHYAAVSFVRPDPIFPLGMSSMLVQGAVMAWLFPRVRGAGGGLAEALKFALIMGAFLGSYMVLAEPAKYQVPSVASWMGVEALATLLQYALFGLLLGLIYRDRQA